MDLDIIAELTIPVIVLACLIVGYVLRNYVSLNNKHIPLLMALLGILLNYLINGYQSWVDTILAGSLSGILSTGLYQAFSKYLKTLSKREKGDEDDECKNGSFHRKD